jgi:hypothetical protein
MIHADMDMDMDSQFAVFLKFPRKFSEYGASFVYLVLHVCAALREQIIRPAHTPVC